MEQKEVKACPFCGEKPSIEVFYEDNSLRKEKRNYYVMCVNPKCLIHARTLKFYKQKGAAVGAWNKRGT